MEKIVVALFLFLTMAAEPALAASHYSACKNANVSQTPNTEAEQNTLVSDLLATRVRSEMQKSVDARDILLKCVSSPKSGDCFQRLRLLRTAIASNLGRLRMALSLSKEPMDLRDHSVNMNITLPGYLGARPLQPLTSAEIERAQKIQKEILAKVDWFIPDDVALEDKANFLSLNLKQCQIQYPQYYESCNAHDAARSANFVRFRRYMKGVYEDIISAFPFAARFDGFPLAKEK